MPLGFARSLRFLSASLRRSWSRTRLWGRCSMSCGTVRKLHPAWGVQLVHLVGVVVAEAAAEDELEAVAGVVWLVVRDGLQVSACVRRAPGRSCRRGGGADGAVRRVGRRASSRLREACSWWFLSAWRWRGWCGSTCGTACMLPLAWGVHCVLLVGVAVAGVVRFDAWDGVHVAACVGHAVCASCRSGCG